MIDHTSWRLVGFFLSRGYLVEGEQTSRRLSFRTTHRCARCMKISWWRILARTAANPQRWKTWRDEWIYLGIHREGSRVQESPLHYCFTRISNAKTMSQRHVHFAIKITTFMKWKMVDLTFCPWRQMKKMALPVEPINLWTTILVFLEILQGDKNFRRYNRCQIPWTNESWASSRQMYSRIWNQNQLKLFVLGPSHFMKSFR